MKTIAPDKNKGNIRDRLKQRRRECGLSQMDLAARSGLHYLTVGRAERNVTIPSPLTLVKLARALGVTVYDLIGELTPEEDSLKIKIAIKDSVRDTLRGNVLRLRHERELSQENLATKSGLNIMTVCRLEHHACTTVRWTTVAKLAAGFGLTIPELMAEYAPASAKAGSVGGVS